MRHLAGLGLWFLAALVLIVALFKVGQQTFALRQQTVQTRAEIAALEARHQELIKLKSAIQGVADKQSKLSVLIPTRKEVLRNIQLLESLSGQTSNAQTITIKEIPPTTKQVKTNIRTNLDVTLPAKIDKVDFEIKLRGGFIDFMKYLSAMENQPFLSVVKEIDLIAEAVEVNNRTKINTGTVETTINGIFYYVKE